MLQHIGALCSKGFQIGQKLRGNLFSQMILDRVQVLFVVLQALNLLPAAFQHGFHGGIIATVEILSQEIKFQAVLRLIPEGIV